LTHPIIFFASYKIRCHVFFTAAVYLESGLANPTLSEELIDRAVADLKHDWLNDYIYLALMQVF